MLGRARMADYSTRENLEVPAEYDQEKRSKSQGFTVMFYTYDEHSKAPFEFSQQLHQFAVTPYPLRW